MYMYVCMYIFKILECTCKGLRDVNLFKMNLKWCQSSRKCHVMMSEIYAVVVRLDGGDLHCELRSHLAVEVLKFYLLDCLLVYHDLLIKSVPGKTFPLTSYVLRHESRTHYWNPCLKREGWCLMS